MSRDILPDQRVTLITLGVRDLDRAKAFYAALGWHPVRETGDMAAYQLRGGVAFALYRLHEMARDQGREEGDLGTGAAVLSQNFHDEDEVDRAWERAMKAGARPLKAPQSMSWGGLCRAVRRSRRPCLGAGAQPLLALGARWRADPADGMRAAGRPTVRNAPWENRARRGLCPRTPGIFEVG
ncbi:putative lactoylglutathione lyase [Rubellimicrobium thermophilum DSM 16684]|uniref:Putative lactoylglutathione lyase n=1 Tax=Rubellimicrobium thermophilum DSM 16684 TaxID=1123069 RepID=S9QXS6_9RHOB|nr:putative lactoylglutathione lyase [Rubellimicrobium thermophilum DSM 16684]